MTLFRRKKRDDEVDPEERSPQLGLKYKDLLVLAQLQENGAKLAEPRHVLHYLYFGSRAGAEAAQTPAAAAGWACEVREPLPESPEEWALVCQNEGVILAPEFVRESTDFF